MTTNTPLSAERLAEIRDLESKATEGEWHIESPYQNQNAIFASNGLVAGTYGYDMGGVARLQDAIFIADARTAVPELLAEVDRLRDELALWVMSAAEEA